MIEKKTVIHFEKYNITTVEFEMIRSKNDYVMF